MTADMPTSPPPAPNTPRKPQDLGSAGEFDPNVIPSETTFPEERTTPVQESPTLSVTLPPSRAKRILKRIGWTSLGLFLLIFFTLSKLPEEPIRNYVQASISSALSDKGMTFTAGESSLSFWLGISYTMNNVSLQGPALQTPVHIDRLTISPSLFPLLFGRTTGRFDVRNGDGKLSGSVSIKNTQFAFAFSSKDMDLGKLGVLPALAQISGSGVLNGDGSVRGDTANGTATAGEVHMNLNKVVIEAQSIMGFSVPRLSISEGKADITIDGGKARITTLRLGKPGNSADDIQADVSGDVTLAKQLEASTLNLKTHFSLSQNVLKAFVLLDALLSPGKLPDGSYSFNLTGPLSSPNPLPAGPSH